MGEPRQPRLKVKFVLSIHLDLIRYQEDQLVYVYSVYDKEEFLDTKTPEDWQSGVDSGRFADSDIRSFKENKIYVYRNAELMVKHINTVKNNFCQINVLDREYIRTEMASSDLYDHHECQLSAASKSRLSEVMFPPMTNTTRDGGKSEARSVNNGEGRRDVTLTELRNLVGNMNQSIIVLTNRVNDLCTLIDNATMIKGPKHELRSVPAPRELNLVNAAAWPVLPRNVPNPV